MPAETIHGVDTPIDLRIAWGNRGDSVQIMSRHHDGETGARLAVEMVNEWCRACGEPEVDFEKIRSLPTTTVPGRRDIPYFQGFTSAVDRRSINDVIRVLRRARNASFGADE